MSRSVERTPSDAELLAAVAEGDPEAFGAVYDEHAPWLLVRLRQRTTDSDLADQIAQETFLVVWRDAGRFQGRGEVGAWIWGSRSGACWTCSARVPPAAAPRALPVTVAQRVGWFRLIEEDEPGLADSPGLGQGIGQQGRPVAPVGTTWGRQGQVLAETQARLAANVAARLVAPPDTVTPPSSAGSKSNPGPGPIAPNFGCNARAVVALWLAARVSPQVADGIRRGVTNTPHPTFTITHDVDFDDVSWGVREGRFALALLQRPGDEVAEIMQGNWDLLTRPDTTLEQLAQLLGVQPPPVSPDSPGVAGRAC
jgi:hypothetical protein